MTAPTARNTPPATTAWDRFWFTPADPRPLVNVRIATGVALLLYFLSWGSFETWLGPDGVFSAPRAARLASEIDGANWVIRCDRWLGTLDSLSFWRLLWGLAAVAAGCMIIGIQTRLATIIAWGVSLLFFHRTFAATGPAEPVLATLLFYLLWTPAHQRWPTWGPFARFAMATTTTPSALANIGLRLLQLHISLLVLSMAQSKLAGPAWWDGDALWYLTARTHSRPSDFTFLREHELLVNALTHAVVVAELLFPALVWLRPTRKIVMGAVGIGWLVLTLFTGDWLFLFAMTAALAAFWPPKASE